MITQQHSNRSGVGAPITSPGQPAAAMGEVVAAPSDGNKNSGTAGETALTLFIFVLCFALLALFGGA